MTGKDLGRAPRVEITVSAEEIENGIGRDSSHCMIAEAIKTNVPHAKYISVDLQTIRWTDSEKRERYTYLTPRSAQVALVQFDQGIKPAPFRFRCRSGHVSRSGALTKKVSNPKRTGAEGTKETPNQSSLRPPVNRAGQGQSVPERVGGKPPPVPKARRRAFGLRSFDR